MAERIEIYKQALLDLQRAIGELDQVHASLKDIGLDRVRSSESRDGHTMNALITQLEQLKTEIETADCPDCDQQIRWHAEPKYDCEKCPWGHVQIPASEGGN